MKIHMKEWIQYGSALAMIASGITLAFLSFFLNHYNIADGVLWYIAQALVFAGGVFGVSVYFKTKVGEMESIVKDVLVEAAKNREREGGDNDEE